MSTGPRTKAGRALLEALSNLAADLPLEFGDEPLERLDIEATLRIILAIEDEAERSAGAAPINVEALLIRIRDNLSNWYVCRLCDRAPNVRGHADDCPMPEIEADLACLTEQADADPR